MQRLDLSKELFISGCHKIVVFNLFMDETTKDGAGSRVIDMNGGGNSVCLG